MDLGPAGGPAEVPQEIPGLARDDGILHGYAPKRVSFKGVVVSVLDGVGQRHADLAIGVDGVGNDLAAVCGQVDWGVVAPQFLRWREGDAITFTVPLLKGEAEPKFNALIRAEFERTIDSADILRTDFPRRDRPGSARRRCRRRVGALGGSSCHPREPEDHS